MLSKVVSKEEALSKIHDGQTIMFGDWHGEFAADEIIDGMLEKGIKDIHAIAVSAGMPDQGVGKLIKDKRVKSLVTTHIALNPLARDQMFAGELDIEFCPQGTWSERIRCGGAGLGGCLTPTGVGTEVENGKQKLTINGKEYLLELPLHADVSLIKATKADTAGNLYFHLNSRATNSTMAFAGDFVNLGIGVPLMCVNYLPEGVELWLEAEIGTVGSGPSPSWDDVDIDCIDAGVKKIIVATDHCEKNGQSKILKKCTLPLTGYQCVTDIVTERCYFEVTPEGLVLREVAPGYTVEDILACTDADVIVPDEVGVMQ